MKTIITILTLIITMNLFSQNTPCENGTFFFQQNKGKFQSMLTKDGNVHPLNSIIGIFTILKVEDKPMFKVESIENNGLKIYNILTDKTVKISYEYEKTKESFKLCYHSFVEQIMPLLNQQKRIITITQENSETPIISFALIK